MAGEINPDGTPRVETPKPAKKGWGWGSLTGTPVASPKVKFHRIFLEFSRKILL